MFARANLMEREMIPARIFNTASDYCTTEDKDSEDECWQVDDADERVALFGLILDDNDIDLSRRVADSLAADNPTRLSTALSTIRRTLTFVVKNTPVLSRA